MTASTQLLAQSSASDKEPATQVTKGPEKDEGGWKYLGQRLAYQVKKRMNLTSEAEDKDAKATSGKKLRLKILGVEVMTPGKDKK